MPNTEPSIDQRLQAWLVCPQCRAPLDAATSHASLQCARGHAYPVTRGIPRLIHTAQLSRIERRSQAAFGYEWSHYVDYNVPNFSSDVFPESAHALTGQLGLDVGCGAGRHLLAASARGATMIGVDQSVAVDSVPRARAPTPMYLVQANLRELPFQHRLFDFVYSWGVLHHTTEPEAAFQSLLPFVKPGGLVIVGLYQASLRKYLLEIPRSLTTRLPLPLVQGLAFLAASVDYYGCVVPYRWAARCLGPRPWVPSHIREYAKYSFRVNQTDWFDRLAAPVTHWYTREQINDWFRRAQLQQVQVDAIGDFWWRGQGRVPV